jgi:Zn-dependent peptidase ImmA (M78 family)/O-acetyl-ADP-ribose deacetylase (regulator of RNase III)
MARIGAWSRRGAGDDASPSRRAMLRDMAQSRQTGPKWTNPSVLALAGSADPMTTVLEEARARVFDAMEKGWTGPPFDPLQLADMLKIPVVPLEEVEDARLVHHQGKPRIEFNPNRSRERVRFSVAHELGHLLFPDAAERVRYRSHSEHARGDDWQIELLCNLAAAEILMPSGSFPELADDPNLDINHLMRLRSEFMVSAESALLRVVRLTLKPAAVFAAARDNMSRDYRIDYIIGSRAWTLGGADDPLSQAAALKECTAVGFTAKQELVLGTTQLQLECVGVPPYPHTRYPRVVGIVRPLADLPAARRITYLHGDAAQPRGEGPRIIAHLVNDATSNWGGSGFAPHLRRSYPGVQDAFKDWAQDHLSLGSSHLFAEPDADLYIFTMVAQHRYGSHAAAIPLSYSALEICLKALAKQAEELGASVHMPMIGAGQARGDWSVIEEMIDRQLSSRDISVTVYLLPGAAVPHQGTAQLGFEF